MEDKEQPPATTSLNAGEEHKIMASRRQTKLRRRTLIILCGSCIAAFLAILATVTTILILVLVRAKAPRIKLNNYTITKLELVNGTIIPKPGVNISLVVDISVKNPNIASFRYGNTTTSLYHRGALVGEARGPPGRSPAWRTVRMNVTVDLITDRMMASPNLSSDLAAGVLVAGTYTRISGRASLLNIFRKHAVMKLNCSMNFNLSSLELVEQNCKRKVHL